MDANARSQLLKKIITNGFSLEDLGAQLVLRPRGAEGTAAITIMEVSLNTWKVISTEGKYKGYDRGMKRKYFEDNLARWVFEATQQVPG